MEILSTLPISDQQALRIKAISEDIHLTILPVESTDEIPPETWEQIEILFSYNILPEPALVPNLKWIQYFLAGADKITGAELFQEKDVLLTSMSGANASQVAEHALTLILALARGFPDFFAKQEQNAWDNKSYTPIELADSTVGIIGYGSIGRQLARLLQAFGTTILAAKRNAKYPNDDGFTIEGKGDPEGFFFTRLYPIEAIKSMVKECDFVVITLPLTKETKDLIGPEEIQAIKSNSFLIDVSRGGIVDQDALMSAIVNNHLAGAGLDVFPLEPLPADNPLWQFPNVIITPHIAGYSKNYNQKAVDLFIANIEKYMAKETLYNIVDFSKGY